jgi:hypothetical protein
MPGISEEGGEEEEALFPMDYWFMPSPSASDGGSDNTSVAAAAVWMRTLAGMLLPKMLSTAAAAGQGAQVAAQDQRALQAGADCLSSAAGTRPGTQTRVRVPAQPRSLAAPAARQGSFGEYIGETTRSPSS